MDDRVFFGVFTDLQRLFSVFVKTANLQTFVCELLVGVHFEKTVGISLESVGWNDSDFLTVLDLFLGTTKLVELYLLNTINGFEA